FSPICGTSTASPRRWTTRRLWLSRVCVSGPKNTKTMFRLRNVTLRSRSVGVFVNPVVVGDTPAGRVVGGVFLCVCGRVNSPQSCAIIAQHDRVGSKYPPESKDTLMAPRAYTTILHDTLARDDDRDVNHIPPLRKS